MLREPIKYFISSVTILVLIVSARAHADEFNARVLRADGEVYIIDTDGHRQAVEENDFTVDEMDTVVTAEDSHAIVSSDEGVLSVLDENSRLRVEKTGWLSQLGGRIYFTFTKVFGKPRYVKTRFATLGIRGTTFIVYDDHGGQSVALQEGLLDIESPGSAFEIYRQLSGDEYETYKQQVLQQQQGMNREYDDYKSRMQSGFIEYKESFTLEPNHVIRFDGVRIDETVIDENIKAEFDNFEAIAGELLQEFRQQSQVYRQRMEEEQKAKVLENELLFDD